MSRYEELKANLLNSAAMIKGALGICKDLPTIESEAVNAIESLERQLAEKDAMLNKMSDMLATVTAQRNLLKDAATEAANAIRRCDYTQARSILLVALASLKGE